MPEGHRPPPDRPAELVHLASEAHPSACGARNRGSWRGRSYVGAMTVDVRTITDDEVPAWVRRHDRGLPPPPGRGRGRGAGGPASTWTARSAPSTATASSARCAPGRATSRCRAARWCRVAALTNVTVASTHRRQGLLHPHARPRPGGVRRAGRGRGHPHRRRVPDLRPLRLRPGGRARHHDRRRQRRRLRRAPRRLGAPGRPRRAAQDRARRSTRRSAASSPARSAGPTTGGTAPAGSSPGAGQEPDKGFVLVGRIGATASRTGYVRYHVDGTWTDRRPDGRPVRRRAARHHPERLRAPVAGLLRGRLGHRGAGRGSLAGRGVAVAAGRRPGRPPVGPLDFIWLRPLDVPALLGCPHLPRARPGRARGGRPARLRRRPLRPRRRPRRRHLRAAPTSAPASRSTSTSSAPSPSAAPSLRVLADAGQVDRARRRRPRHRRRHVPRRRHPWCSTWF